MNSRRKFAIISSAAYATCLFVAILHMELGRSLLKEIPLALVPYITVIIFTLYFGAKFSDWYFPVDDEQLDFEYILAPITIVFGAILIAGFSFGIAMSIHAKELNDLPKGILLLSLFSSMFFLYFNWVILLFGCIITSAFLAYYAKYLTKQIS